VVAAQIQVRLYWRRGRPRSHLQRNEAGEIGYRFYVGGGLGRMPLLGKLTNEFVPESDPLIYAAAIMRVFNRFGRRDNIHHARIKVVVKTWGLERFIEMFKVEYQRILDSDEAAQLRLLPEDVEYMRGFFPKREFRPGSSATWPPTSNPVNYSAFISPKPHNVTGGDVSNDPTLGDHPGRALARDEIAGRPLLALEFPKFDDGRALTQARVLRGRLGYHSDLRAVGDILQYLVFVARRCGSSEI